MLRGTNFCAQNLVRMLNMASILKNAQKSSSREPVGQFFHRTWYVICSIWDSSPSQFVQSNDGPWKTLTNFTARYVLET